MTKISRTHWARGVGVVVLTSLLWSGLSLWLWSDGHSPSGPSPFGEEHFRVQAFVVPLVLMASSHTFAWVVWKTIGTRGDLTWGDWSGRVLEFYGLGLGVGWVIPDLIAYAIGGHDALKVLAPVLPIVSCVMVVVLAVRFVRAQATVSLRRAIGSVCLAWLAQAVVVMAIIR